MKERIYVCHTYYHVYISFLKELQIRAEVLQKGEKWEPGATILLSTLSNHFEALGERLMRTGIPEQVLPYEEKRDTEFPQLAKWRQNTGNFARNMLQRIRFTRAYAKLLAVDVPVDFRAYGEIYVYCDSDPIGFYLNQYKIPYHAVEDGFNCLKNYDSARYDNRGHFGIKVFFSKRLNLIFIQNGYGKYCLDMEVNDRSVLKYDAPFYVEKPRSALVERLTPGDKDLILQAFVRNKDQLERQLKESAAVGDRILILTDPLCTMDVRERIMRDLVETYRKEGTVFLKPHPRDYLDYDALFSDVPRFDSTVPMEMLNFMPYAHFKKVVSVLTEIKSMQCADELERLGEAFMDKYEDPLVHRQNEQI